MGLEYYYVPDSFRNSLVGDCSGDDFWVWVARKIAEAAEDSESEDNSEG